MSYAGADRRLAQRAKLVTFCPAFLGTGRDEEIEAMMCDVSERGAGFRIERPDTRLKLKRNTEITLRIRTPYGEARCKGRVVWLKRTGDEAVWGMQFTELSKDAKDPLRCLIDSSF